MLLAIGFGRGTRARLPAGAMLELNGGYDESPAEDSDGPAAGRQRRAENRAGASLPAQCMPWAAVIGGPIFLP